MKMYLFNSYQLSGMTFRCLVSYQNQFCTKTTIVYEYFLGVGRDGLGLQRRFSFVCVDHFYTSYYQISRQEVSEAMEHCVQVTQSIIHLCCSCSFHGMNAMEPDWCEICIYIYVIVGNKRSCSEV